jgi:hypothetical protein
MPVDVPGLEAGKYGIQTVISEMMQGWETGSWCSAVLERAASLRLQ